MGKMYLILCCLILTSCIKKEKVESNIFTDEKTDHWEIATYDTIANLYDRNRNNKRDSFELNLLGNHYLDLYHHQARRSFIDDLKNDTVFLNAHIDKCIIVEESKESNLGFAIFYNLRNTTICLSYKFVYKEDINNKVFVLEKKDTINKAKFEAFIQKVRVSNLFKNESNNGEYYNGEVIMSLFSKNEVEAFPYLTFNFSNEIFRSYNEMFK